MKKTLHTILFVAISGIAAYQASAQKLEVKWESDTLLSVPESVLFDAAKNILYVSCIDGKPDEKDGKGYIAKVTTDGKIEKLDWVTGLDAPKGMGIYKNSLYVADVTRIDIIDISSGKITSKVEVEGSKFLNDITVDKNGTVYVSDSQTGKIHILKNGKAEVYFESTEFKGPNGLLALNNGLYVLDFGNGINYKLAADKKLTKFGETASGADGVVLVGKDEYLVSSWHGEIYFVNAQGQATKLLDTKEQKINAADIEFDSKTKTVFVPTFFKNNVVAYTFSK
jgi:sugar lactone lactonase YvrE